MSMIPAPMPSVPEVSDDELLLFQQLFKHHIGLHLPSSKKALLQSRLGARVHELGLTHLSDYHALIAAGANAAERQRAIDLITTNETYFFREQAHFDFVADQLLPAWRDSPALRIWSAASSTGEEAYTLAMVLDHHRPRGGWSVFGSDVSTRVLRFARRALYPMVRGQHIPAPFLKRYCLRGTGRYGGHFLVQRALRDAVQFGQRNLTDLGASDDGQFDLVFLRNVIIYFDGDTKRKVLGDVLQRLRPGGYLVVGHAESLHGMHLPLEMLWPSVYRKPS